MWNDNLQSFREYHLPRNVFFNSLFMLHLIFEYFDATVGAKNVTEIFEYIYWAVTAIRLLM